MSTSTRSCSRVATADAVGRRLDVELHCTLLGFRQYACWSPGGCAFPECSARCCRRGGSWSLKKPACLRSAGARFSGSPSRRDRLPALLARVKLICCWMVVDCAAATPAMAPSLPPAAALQQDCCQHRRRGNQAGTALRAVMLRDAVATCAISCATTPASLLSPWSEYQASVHADGSRRAGLLLMAEPDCEEIEPLTASWASLARREPSDCR